MNIQFLEVNTVLELTRRNNNRQADYYNPFREMEEFERRFFGRPFAGFMTDSFAEFKTDITDKGDFYLLEADLPGFYKENIQLDLEGDTLIIRAERNSENEEKDSDSKVIRHERSFGRYTRQFDVSNIDTDSIRCKYENGVLKINLPKKQSNEKESRKLEIE